jgi:DMSO/TMAO reductase YedYZ molybdopterin-dependent catalytic subunit
MAIVHPRRGPRRARDPRLPPGQYDVGDSFPVLTAEVSPRMDPAAWTFRLDGLVARPTVWTWEQIHRLPGSTYSGDIHCVTTWSKLGTSFTGVSLDTLFEQAMVLPQARHIVAWSSTGYTSNLPLEHVVGGQAWVVWEHEGRALPQQHGGPARLLVPHLYFWKSVKWVAGVRLLDHDEPGFWETRGYHALGDPWTEQRYDGD